MTLAAALLVTAYLVAFVVLNRRASRKAGGKVDHYRHATGLQALTAWLFRIGFIGSLIWGWWRHFAGLSASVAPAMSLIGTLVIVAGAGLALWAQWTMSASWRMGAVEGGGGALIEQGPFGFSRNPTFVGHMMIFSGAWIVSPDIPQAILAMAVIAAAVIQVGIEEPVLRRDPGAAYEAYAARVPRWLGWPGR